MLKNPEVANICKEKNEENTKDILEYMKKNSKKQIRVIELSLEAMEKKLENIDMFTSLKDVATVYGVLYDKVIKCKELELKEKELSFKNNAEQDILDKLDNLLEEQKKSYGGNDAEVD